MVKTTIRINDELMLAAKHRALDEGISFQEMVEMALRQYLKKPWTKGKRRPANETERGEY